MPRWDNVPQAQKGCQISTLIYRFGGNPYISHEILQKDGIVLCHLGLKSKVLPVPFTDVSA